MAAARRAGGGRPGASRGRYRTSGMMSPCTSERQPTRARWHGTFFLDSHEVVAGARNLIRWLVTEPAVTSAYSKREVLYGTGFVRRLVPERPRFDRMVCDVRAAAGSCAPTACARRPVVDNNGARYY
jgi:hypothetical protein